MCGCPLVCPGAPAGGMAARWLLLLLAALAGTVAAAAAPRRSLGVELYARGGGPAARPGMG